ncbi:TPA: NAD(P)H-dependent oxidoreductase, partial [Acinetobacter baumannii]|nr:NAD(P)H-dependent oxidoreductase [Acinetobacter baumannii]
MNILIVHAHPEPLSFTTSLKTTAQQTFKKLGHQVEISDLYAM